MGKYKLKNGQTLLIRETKKAKIVNIDGLRVWYTFIDTNNTIFNVQQGLSKDGKIIYDSFLNQNT